MIRFRLAFSYHQSTPEDYRPSSRTYPFGTYSYHHPMQRKSISKPLDCQPWLIRTCDILAIICSTVFTFLSSLLNCTPQGQDEGSCRSTPCPWSLSSFILFSLRVFCNGARNRAFKAYSSTRCWGLWKKSARTWATRTRTFQESRFLEPIKCLYQIVSVWFWNMPSKEENAFLLCVIQTRKKAKTSI